MTPTQPSGDIARPRELLAGLASDPTLPFAMQQIVAALAEYPHEPGGEDWTAIALDRFTHLEGRDPIQPDAPSMERGLPTQQPRRWLIRTFLNPWLSLGFHVDHRAPQVTLHLPGRCVAIGNLRPADYDDRGSVLADEQALTEALGQIRDELGAPMPNDPAPLGNAKAIARNALASPAPSLEGQHGEVDAGAPGEVQHLPRLIQDAFAISGSEGRRLITQGAVRLNGRVVDDLDVRLAEGRSELQVGKRRIVGLRCSPATAEAGGTRDDKRRDLDKLTIRALKGGLVDRTKALHRAHYAMGTVATWLTETNTSRQALAAKLREAVVKDAAPTADEILRAAQEPAQAEAGQEGALARADELEQAVGELLREGWTENDRRNLSLAAARFRRSRESGNDQKLSVAPGNRRIRNPAPKDTPMTEQTDDAPEDNYPNSDRLTIEEWRVIENAKGASDARHGRSRLMHETALGNLDAAVVNLRKAESADRV